MQGIGVSANKGNIEYNEKQGLILNHLKEAIRKPNQAFAIVLEEIQENNLNELIGDLIYLIEDEKRTDVADFIKDYKGNKEFESFDNFVDTLIKAKQNTHFVQIPYLVSTKTKYRKLILPKNLYFFCTSNYRDDKKILEDNLLRRFDLIELYPKTSVIKNEAVGEFLENLNNQILEILKGKEIHPDRFLIGHAYWIIVNDKKSFYRALLKTITEFKDIREIEFKDVKKFFEKIDFEKTPFETELSILKAANNYKDLIFDLQEKAFGDLLKDNND
jgi:coenzyme F420-reducing hydrogenase alpha subunit